MDIRLFSYRGVSIKCSPAVIVLAGLAVIFDMWVTLLIAFVSLTMHELSHAFTAWAVGMRIEAMEIQPFGFVARLSGKISPMDEFAVAASGPLFSIITACVAAYATNYIFDKTNILNEFIRFNIILGILNLIPAMPLDGGRMLKSVLERFLPSNRALMISVWPGIIFGLALTAFGIYIIVDMRIFNVTPIIMGTFLFMAALKERRNSNTQRLTAMIRRADMINRGQYITTRYTAMHKSVKASDALRTLSMNRYNIITVVDENMKKLGELDESRLMNGMAASGDDVTIGELLVP